MSEHYYTENPNSEIRERRFEQTINGASLKLTAVSGVFAFEGRVDRVSELLIRHLKPTGGSVLDMGCGYGAIGLFIKAAHPGQAVCLADINSRAVEYALANAAANGLGAETVKSDLFEEFQGRSFDDIVSNPPFAAGKKLNIRLINEALDHLNPGGALWLVAFHNKGGATLKEIMKERFGNAEDMEKSGGIRVYRSVREAREGETKP